MTYLDLFCRCVLGGVFLFAAAGKLRNRMAFGQFAESLRVLGLDRLSTFSAGMVIAAELAAVALLASFRFAGWGYLLGAAVLLVFNAAIGLTLRLRRTVACHCFGAAGQPLGVVHLVRNAVLVTVAAAGLMGRAGGALPAPGAGGAVLTVAGAAVIVAIVVRWDDLVFLFRGYHPTSRQGSP